MHRLLLPALLLACGDPSTAPTADASPAPTSACGSVRTTSYAAATGGWCEFDRTAPMLPAAVQAGMTLAIAEPYNGGSYGGEPGESCGECWEIDTINGTQTVMVHDLCPVAGNPLCAGGHFHFDLAGETADALGTSGLNEATARRVPCPVAGNVFLQINDRNEWGYVRFQILNHRVPVRSVLYRSADGGDFRPAERSGGAWHILDGNDVFASDGPGGIIRIDSAQGEELEMPSVLAASVTADSFFDLGAQLTDQDPAAGPTCVFVPPAAVYGDGFGGIPEVLWAINPWGDESVSEPTSGCAAGTARCLRVASLDQWSGFHLYYRQAFPTSTFVSLSISLRAATGGGDVTVAPSDDGAACAETTVTVGAEWTTATIDVATVCAGTTQLNGVTVQNRGPAMTLMVNEVRFTR